MIHRAPFGSMERFVAVLIEHCGGNFPLWLAPDQFIILPISEKYHDYAEKVSQLLKNYDICGPIDHRAETTGRKIRDAEISKIIEGQYKRAIEILQDHKDKLILLANRLLEKEVIFKDDLEKIFGTRPFDSETIEEVNIENSEDHDKTENTLEKPTD